MNNTADINYFKDPLANKTGEEAFKNRLPSILESHEENIKRLGTQYVFDTIADAQAYTEFIPEIDRIELLGYYSKNDGAGHERFYSLVDNGTGISCGSGFLNLSATGLLVASCLGARTGNYDNTSFIQKGINFLQSQGGGVLVVDKAYQCLDTIYVTQKNICISGLNYKGQLYREDGSSKFIINATIGTTPSGNNFNIDKLVLAGGTGNTSERGLYLENIYGNSKIEVKFDGFQTCLQLANVYGALFEECIFRNYEIAVAGSSENKWSNDNKFHMCVWDSGKTAIPSSNIHCLVAQKMSFTTFDNCIIESRGYIGDFDLYASGTGGGNNTLLNCRFEQMNNNACDWVVLGNNDKWINSALYASSSHKPFGTNLDVWGIKVKGKGAVIENHTIESNLAQHIILLDDISSDCKVSVKFDLQATSCNNPIMDLGTNNEIEYISDGFTKGNVSWSNKISINRIDDSIGLSSFVAGSGVTKTEYTTDANPNSVLQRGIQNDGKVHKIVSTVAGGLLTVPYAVTAGYTYNFSFYVFVPSNTDIEIGFNGDYRNGYRILNGRWVRIFCNFDCTVTGTYNFAIRIPISTIYITAPMLTEYLSTTHKQGLEGYFRTGVGQINKTVFSSHTEYEKKTNIAPIFGRHYQGEVWENIVPLGTVGTAEKWVCTATGTTGTFKQVNFA